ncbi:MAG: type II toxin-antitoxin system YafQ family toxin [Microcoleus sp.]
MKVYWTPKSIGTFKQLVRQNNQLCCLVKAMLETLSEDFSHPSLQTHKMSGDLSGVWSCSRDYNYYIFFEFVTDAENSEKAAILLLTMGTFDEIYS